MYSIDYKYMNLKHLRLFYAVAEAGSISGGARRLHISQPAVTRQLMDFEARLGARLLHRLPRGVRLTETGTALQDYARRIFTLEREAQQTVHAIESLEAGELYIGASTTIGNYLLPQVMATFQRCYPGVAIRMEIANTKRIGELVESWTLALGFIEGPSSIPSLQTHVFMRDELMPVVGDRHALAHRSGLTFDDLADVPFILREPGSGTRQVVESRLSERAWYV